MKQHEEIENSIIKKYRKDIWRKFTKALNEYQLINNDDYIMVCISGGKDSFLLAKCIQELSRHGKISFKAEFVVMDPGYSKTTVSQIKKLAKNLNVPINIFKTDIFQISNKLAGDNPCYMCARMRRGHLYNKAKELGCNKIALGHHFDDVVETILLSMFYSSEIKTMMPKLHSDNFKGIELIRPLYLVKESSIIAWAKYNELEFINCACAFTKKGETLDISKRKEIKQLIKQLKQNNNEIDNNIFKSVDNINLNCVLGTKKDGVYKSFLDDYDIE